MLALLVVMIQHGHSLRTLRAEYGDVVPLSLATLVASLFALLGLIAFVAVLLRR